jgi:hypothetical protein
MHVDRDVFERLQILLSDREPCPERPGDAALDPAGEPDETIDRFSPSGEWDRLIDQVQGVAQHFRTIEKRIHQREVRLDQLLARAEQELNAAAERVRLAEVRAAEIEAWAELEVAEAARRTASAEARTRALDAVLAQLREVMLAEVPQAAEVVRFSRPKPATGVIQRAA